jgi:hypothetical protein
MLHRLLDKIYELRDGSGIGMGPAAIQTAPRVLRNDPNYGVYWLRLEV